MVELDVDQKVILQRIEARWIHEASGRVYNLDYNPPKVPFKDDVTGEALTKRQDDTARRCFKNGWTSIMRRLSLSKCFTSSKGCCIQLVATLLI